MKRSGTGMGAGQGFPPSMRKAHPTMMTGIDRVQLPNKPRLSRSNIAWLRKHGAHR